MRLEESLQGAEISEAVEVWQGEADAALLLTCEHASNALPPPWQWPEEDQWLVDTHWAIDLGIAEVTRALARELGAPAVLARFSRLLIDVNRAVEAETCIRTHAEGKHVQLNFDLTEAERHARITRLYEPYHAAADALLHRYPCRFVLSMHSFTPVYEGAQRGMEIGVLFDEEEEIAHALAETLRQEGWAVALNEPYSGRHGLIYSAGRHASRHGRRALELEIRQDVATDPVRRPGLVRSLHRALAQQGLARPEVVAPVHVEAVGVTEG